MDVDETWTQAYDFSRYDAKTWEELREVFEWRIPDRFNAAHYLCDRHAGREERVAVFYEDHTGREGTLTYRRMKRDSNRLANVLGNHGVGPGDRVAVCVPQKPEVLVAHLAAWKLGAVSVPLSVLFGEDGLAFRLRDSKSRALVVDGEKLEAVRNLREEVPDLETVIVTGDAATQEDEVPLEDALAAGDPHRDVADTRPDDDMMIFYTSGTTGDPKGVVHTHDLPLGQLPGFTLLFGNGEVREEDVSWIPAGWAWMGSMNFILPTLFYGRAALAHHDPGPFDPMVAFELIEKYGLSVLFIPPTALRMMKNALEDPGEQYDLETVRNIGSGGEKLGKTLPEWAKEVFGATVQEGYGQTEATPVIANCQEFFEYRLNIGKPLPGVDAKIVKPDRSGEEVPPGETGELVIRVNENPVIMKEYLNRPEQTAGKFTEDREWMYTEDLVTVDEDGYYDFVSRADDVIISAGYRMGPEEIEDAVATHPAVVDCAVIGIPDETRGEIPKAFVVLVEGESPSEQLVQSIQDRVRDRLARHEYPRAVEFLDELPRTTTGKIRRTDLRET